MDAAALAEDEAAHLGIPAARLVAEVDAGLQQLLDADLCGQVGSLVIAAGYARRPARGPGSIRRAGPRPRSGGVGAGTCAGRIEPRNKTRRLGSRLAVYFSPVWPSGDWLPSAASSARRSSTGGLDSQVEISPVRGWLNISFAACRNCRVRPSPPALAAPVLRVARRPVADRRQVRADLVRAAGLEPARAAVSWRAVARSTSKRVTAARAVAARRYHRAARAIAPDRRVDRPLSESGWPVTSARYSRAHLARLELLASAAWASSVFATTSSPDVSRSSRWTMPARSGSGPPAARPRSASASVAPRCPACRVGDQAGRLVDHHQVRVLVDDLEVAGRRLGGAPAPASLSTSTTWPAASGGSWAALPRPPAPHRRRSAAGPPSASARPWAARKASRRSPASSAAASSRLRAASPPPPRAGQHADRRCTSRPR